MARLEGMQLGNYELLEHLGTGGMAEVYRARQRQAFDREVAVKVLKRGLAEDPAFRERFLREGQATARLEHPHILPLIELGQAGRRGKQVFLVMPYVRGGTLRDLLARIGGPLPIETIRVLFPQLCEAIHYAHEQGLIHRDIKPSNILLQHERHVLLADFGIALDTEEGRLTSTGMGLGTPEYTAPEQARGLADRRSDLYSLGVVLFELLTGRVPFTGRTAFEILYQHTTAPAPALRAANPALPASLEGLEAVIQRALAKAPDQRFQTAVAFNEAAQAALAGLPIAAAAPANASLLSESVPAQEAAEQQSLPPAQEAAALEPAASSGARTAADAAQEMPGASQPALEAWSPPRAFLPLPVKAAERRGGLENSYASGRTGAEADPLGERPTLLASSPGGFRRLLGPERRQPHQRPPWGSLLLVISLLALLLLGGVAALFVGELLNGFGSSPLSAAHAPTATHGPQTPSPQPTLTPRRTPTLTPDPTVSPSPGATNTPAAPQLVVTPSSLTFSVSLAQCPVQHPTQSLTIQNTGGGTLTWQASPANPALLVLTPTSGSVHAGASEQMTVSLICPATPVNTTDDIHVTSNAGAVDIPVTIIVS